MKIGKATVPQSAICAHNPDAIVVRGQDLCNELIGQVNFADYFYLLLTGRKPDAPASTVLNATLVAIAEHGLVPSVQAARMTLAAAPDALQGAVAAGILGCGSVILGASETAGRLFDEIDRAAPAHGGDLHAAVRAVVAEWRARKQAVPGYGHPVHKERDPRVDALFRVSKQAGGGQHVLTALGGVGVAEPHRPGAVAAHDRGGHLVAVVGDDHGGAGLEAVAAERDAAAQRDLRAVRADVRLHRRVRRVSRERRGLQPRCARLCAGR